MMINKEALGVGYWTSLKRGWKEWTEKTRWEPIEKLNDEKQENEFKSDEVGVESLQDFEFNIQS